jgi:Rrf2 family iron-sulfur cluster assembly transcriptional regulator
LWSELGNQIFLFLSSVSLADVVENRILGASGLNLFPPAPITDLEIQMPQEPELRVVE